MMGDIIKKLSMLILLFSCNVFGMQTRDKNTIDKIDAWNVKFQSVMAFNNGIFPGKKEELKAELDSIIQEGKNNENIIPHLVNTMQDVDNNRNAAFRLSKPKSPRWYGINRVFNAIVGTICVGLGLTFLYKIPRDNASLYAGALAAACGGALITKEAYTCFDEKRKFKLLQSVYISNEEKFKEQSELFSIKGMLDECDRSLRDKVK